MYSGKPSNYYLPISIKRLALYTVSLPLFAFIFCLVYTFIYNFEESTQTHCDVPNWAPSISAAIGSFIPQKFVWQACIAIHSVPRFIFAFLYLQYFLERIPHTDRNHTIIKSSFWLNVVENVALVGLSLITSKERFEAHKICFTLFAICSSLYMCLTFYLFARGGFVAETRTERQSLKYKKRILTVYLGCLPILIFFYGRHNEYCEPYVYSFFCFFEYILVIFNMCYHLTAYYDLGEVTLIIPRQGTSYEYAKEQTMLA